MIPPHLYVAPLLLGSLGAADGAIAAHALGRPPVLGALIVGAYFAAMGVGLALLRFGPRESV